MPLKEILLPAMGEGITDATIIRWLVSEGEAVKTDQPLVEIATDKVDSEIPSPINGKIKKILCLAGSIPRVGETIALLVEEGDEDISENDSLQKTYKPDNANITLSKGVQKRFERKIIHSVEKQIQENTELPFIPPYVRLVTSRLKIDLHDLANFFSLDSNSSINKRHIEEYISQCDRNIPSNNIGSIIDTSFTNTNNANNTTESEPKDYGPNIEVLEMSRIRKIIANQMVKSSTIIPHVTSYIEVDITDLVQWRDKIKKQFQEIYNTKLTLTPIFIMAIVKALKEYPEINVSLDGNNILFKKEINIGMATVLPDKNLIVPVIKNADALNIQGLALAVNDLSARARSGELLPHEIIGSTFTFTNIGVFGTLTGTPIINHPEAAILAIGAINKKPFVVNTPQGNTIGIRDVIILSLAYDHRLIDGSLGGLFLKEVAESFKGINESVVTL